jgi:hypothetical protein
MMDEVTVNVDFNEKSIKAFLRDVEYAKEESLECRDEIYHNLTTGEPSPWIKLHLSDGDLKEYLTFEKTTQQRILDALKSTRVIELDMSSCQWSGSLVTHHEALQLKELLTVLGSTCGVIKLRCASFGGDGSDLMLYRSMFQSFRHMKTLRFSFGRDVDALKFVCAGLENHPSLECLELRSPSRNYAALRQICHGIPRLERIELRCGWDHGDFDCLAFKHFLGMNAPVDVKLVDLVVHQDKWTDFCDAVSAANVKRLEFAHQCHLIDGTKLGQAFEFSLLESICFKTLFFYSEDQEEPSRFMAHLAKALSTMPNLLELSLPAPPKCNMTSFEGALARVVEASGTCQLLQTLEITVCSYSEQLDVAFARCICQSASLRAVTIDYERPRTHIQTWVSPAVVNALAKQFSIRQLAFVSEFCSPWDECLQPAIDCYLRLNDAGREYMALDASNVRAGIQVLATVTDDLSCLYLHLRENPLLCSSQRPSNSSGRCRKRSWWDASVSSVS